MSGRKYVHWLKINAYVPTNNEVRQYVEIQGYLDRHPEASAEIFRYDYVLCDRVIRLVCHEQWNDLVLDANTGSHSLQRLTQKPRNLHDRRPFCIPKYMAPYVERLAKRDAA